MRKSDYEVFENKFKPIPSDDGIDDRGIDEKGILLYCNNDKIDEYDDNYIWTVVSGDNGKWYIVPGFHFVNREYYIITEIPWKEGQRDYKY